MSMACERTFKGSFIIFITTTIIIEVTSFMETRGFYPSCFPCVQSDDDCCNNCEEVREAYRQKGWALSNPDLFDQVYWCFLLSSFSYFSNDIQCIDFLLDENYFTQMVYFRIFRKKNHIIEFFSYKLGNLYAWEAHVDLSSLWWYVLHGIFENLSTGIGLSGLVGMWLIWMFYAISYYFYLFIFFLFHHFLVTRQIFFSKF